MINIKEKIKTPYKVTGVKKAVKDVDTSKRVVTGLFNSHYFIDSDNDMLLPGSAKKSIQERGAGSKKGNKIKHLKNHDWSKVIARIDVLEEKQVTIDGRQLSGIYHESYYPETVESDDMLVKIKEGLYDDRSIGFIYDKVDIAEKNSENEDYAKNWQVYYPMAINPEKADEKGFFYVVKEIKLFEGSDVAFGANALTPFLGMKSADKKTLTFEIRKKVDIIEKLFKNGTISDEGYNNLNMEIAQLKSFIKKLDDSEPSAKDTLISRHISDTSKKSINEEQKLFYKKLLK